jgi:hypothetical protein
VIWLNEAQHYLLTPESALGEQVAAKLRALLRAPERGPVLLLVTIWPEYWATLTTVPGPERLDDPHAHARALLTGIDIRVPDGFSGHSLQAMQTAAKPIPGCARQPSTPRMAASPSSWPVAQRCWSATATRPLRPRP